jgi:glucokinase
MDDRLAIGVETGGTKLQVALGRGDGTILAVRRGSVAAESGAQGILEWVDRETALLLEDAVPVHGKPHAIGVGFGGPVESATGRVLTSHQIAGWQGVELKKRFEDRFELPTVVANDANAACWGEYCCGAGRGTKNFCYMNIGSGIGGAFVIDGELYDGQGFGAGEIGHTYVPDWTAAEPGAAAKLENLCSGWAIEKRIRRNASVSPNTPLGRRCGGDRTIIT